MAQEADLDSLTPPKEDMPTNQTALEKALTALAHNADFAVFMGYFVEQRNAAQAALYALPENVDACVFQRQLGALEMADRICNAPEAIPAKAAAKRKVGEQKYPGRAEIDPYSTEEDE